MHELSLAQSLVDILTRVAAEHGLERVASVRLELGALSCVEPRSLALAFEVVARGTPAEGCRVVHEQAPLVVACPSCGYEGPADPGAVGCPRCEGVPVRVVSGRETRVVSVTVDDDG